LSGFHGVIRLCLTAFWMQHLLLPVLKNRRTKRFFILGIAAEAKLKINRKFFSKNNPTVRSIQLNHRYCNMSTRRSTRIKKVSIRCNGDVDSVSPDLSEGEKTVSVAGVVAIFSNEGEDAEEDDAEEVGDDDGDGEHNVSSDELEQKLSGKKRYQAPTRTSQRRNCSGAGTMKNRRLRI